ncbi:MAG TPA: hypothetical protein VLA69_00845 [Gaiellaceae bacterium]|nr:hypothetical protein [Gaiellaceae bacterium]
MSTAEPSMSVGAPPVRGALDWPRLLALGLLFAVLLVHSRTVRYRVEVTV